MRRAALSMFVAALLAAGAAAAGAVGACGAPANAPANDCFANAGVLSSAESGSATGTNVGSSKEPGEPDHAGNPGGASIWYAWTAPASFDVAFTTAGSAFDTLLTAYTGSTVDALQLVAANDDAGGLQSRVEFAAAAGTTYMVAVDGYGGATGSVTLAWERLPDAPPPPPNDDFAAAHVLPSAETGSVTGTNVDATKEAGEPNHAGNRGGASVWYAWTAPAAAGVRFSTEGSSFDTVLAVYTGAAVDALAPVAANDDAIGLQSSVQFEAAAGVTYAIAVDGFGGATGSTTLSWDPVDAQPPSAPPNDSFANAVEIGGAAGQVGGTTLDGTAELGEPDHAGQPAQRSVWYRWTSPADTRVTFQTSARLLGVYEGEAVDALTDRARNARLSFTENRARAEVRAGEVLSVAVDDVVGPGRAFTLAWNETPANDDRGDAGALEGVTGQVRGTTVGATFEVGDPLTQPNIDPFDPDDEAGIATVWYRWTSPADAVYEFATLAVPDNGTRPLVEVVSGSERVRAHRGLDGRISFFAPAGQTFDLMVQGRRVDRGFDLEWHVEPPPPNDAFSTAEVLTGSRGSVSGDTWGATIEPGEPDHAGVPGTGSVWYRWTAPADGRYTFTAFAEDALLTVYTGNRVDALTPMAANDDLPDFGKSVPPGSDDCQTATVRHATVSLAAEAGVTYSIAVDGFGGVRSDHVLDWHPTPANDNLAEAAVLPGAVGSTSGTTFGATREAGESIVVYDCTVASVWYRWTAPHDGLFRLATSVPGSEPGDFRRVSLVVWEGDDHPNLRFVESVTHDPQLQRHPETVRLRAVEGQSFLVQVAPEFWNNEEFLLEWTSVPDNDEFEDATVIEGTAGSVSGTTVGAVKQFREPQRSDLETAHSVWYRWTAPVDGLVQFRLDDGTVLPWTGDAVEGLRVELDASNGFAPPRSFTIDARAGVTYHLQVEALAGDPAPFTLEWGPPVPVVLAGFALPAREGVDDVVEVPVDLRFPPERPVTVTYETRDQTASAGMDYEPAAGTLTFEPGVTTISVPVRVLDDVLDEDDRETFELVLLGADGATTVGGPGIGTIRDDDGPTLSVGDVTVREPDDGSVQVLVPFTLDQPTHRTVEVTYEFRDATATFGVDYLPEGFGSDKQKALEFAPFQTEAVLAIDVLGDFDVEGDEEFRVLAVDATNAVVADEEATARILDEDAPPVVGPITASPAIVALGTSVELRAAASDPDTGDELTATWDLGDGNVVTAPVVDGQARVTHTYARAGLYTATLTVADLDGLTGSAVLEPLPVVDRGRWLTGSGQVDTAEGRLTFDVDARYVAGGAAPVGEFEATLPDGRHLQATSYEWLVIRDALGWFQATGTLDGAPVAILLAAADEPDRLRLRVTDAAGAIAFDTQPGAHDGATAEHAVARGQVRLHTAPR